MTTFQIISLVIAGVSAAAFVGTLVFAVLAYRLQRNDYYHASLVRARKAVAMADVTYTCMSYALLRSSDQTERDDASYAALIDACERAHGLAADLELEFPNIGFYVDDAVRIAWIIQHSDHHIPLKSTARHYDAVIHCLGLTNTHSFQKKFLRNADSWPELKTQMDELNTEQGKDIE